MKYLESVSAILICRTSTHDELLMVQRQSYLKSFPGFFAFPGGKLETDETQLSALQRELKEELNIHIDILSLEKKAIYLGKAITPDFHVIKYVTHFYIYYFDVHSRPQIDLCPDEHKFYDWKPIQHWFQDYLKGILLVVPPTLSILKCLPTFESGVIYDLSHQFNKLIEIPIIYPLNEFGILIVPSVTLPPAHSTNAFYFGDVDYPKVLIDPSPQDEQTLKCFIYTLEKASMRKIDSIILTHHHPDHHQFCTNLALHFNVPILLSKQTYDYITNIQNDYFANVKVQFINEGSMITKWLGHDVLTMSTPGHDRGQLSFYSDNLEFFIASDLFQTQGSVVIPLKEGDMDEYFTSLDRVIKLNPRVVVPSHGLPCGGIAHLERTKNHRLLRQEQIRECLRMNMNIDQILENLYQGIDDTLKPLAKMNIVSHLKSIQK